MEIKPCPSCGSDSKLRISGPVLSDERYVVCDNCDSYGPSGESIEDAIKLWNAAPRKGDVKMKKSCANCRQLYKATDGKYRCGKSINETYNCRYWEASITPYESCLKGCTTCKHLGFKVVNNNTVILNCCDHEIPHPENYVCQKWEETPAPLPICNKPLNPSNSSGLDTLCQAAVNKWGATAQIYKTIEELSELITALARYQNADENSDVAILSAADNVREEREDVEIMLRQLDVIVLRSEEWQRKKYAHLQLLVGGAKDE